MIRTLLSTAEISLVLSVLILLLLLFTRIVGKRFTAGCRYILWTIIILRLCIPISFSIFPAIFEIQMAPVVSETIQEITVKESVQNYTEGSEENLFEQTEQPEYIPDIQSAAYSDDTVVQNDKRISRETLISIIGTVWLTSAFFLFAFRITGYLRIRYRLQRICCHPSEAQSALCRRMGKRMGLNEKQIPPLYITQEVHSPMLCGFFRPVILLPEIPLTDNQLTGILAHELTHRRRGDLWMKLACTIAVSLHWFNPLVYIAASHCAEEMELSCDETILCGMASDVRVSYGRVMLAIIKRCTKTPSELTTHFNPHHSAVKERFVNILDATGKHRGVSLILITAFLCTTAGSLVGFRSEAPLSFEQTAEYIITDTAPNIETPAYEVEIHPVQTFDSFGGNTVNYQPVECAAPDMSVLEENRMPFDVRSTATPEVLYAKYQISYMSKYTNIFAAAGTLLADGTPGNAYVYNKTDTGWTITELPAPKGTVCKGVVLRGIQTENGKEWLLGLMADNGSIRFFRSEDGSLWTSGENVLHPENGKSWLVQYSRHSGVGGETLCLVFSSPLWEKEHVWLSFDWGETFTEYEIPVTETLPDTYRSLRYLGKTGASGNGEYALYFYASGEKANHHIKFLSSQGQTTGTVSIYTYKAKPQVRRMISEYRYNAPDDNGGIFWKP